MLSCGGLGYTPTEALIAGMSATVSSTILASNSYLRRFCITSIRASFWSVCCWHRDFIAILALLALAGNGLISPPAHEPDLPPHRRFWLPLPTYWSVGYSPLIARFDRFQGVHFFAGYRLRLGIAELSHTIGLSSRNRAFVAGIMIATSPISQYICHCTETTA